MHIFPDQFSVVSDQVTHDFMMRDPEYRYNIKAEYKSDKLLTHIPESDPDVMVGKACIEVWDFKLNDQ